MESVRGTEKQVSFHSLVECKPCDGTGAKPGTKPTTCTQCNGKGMETMKNGPMIFQMNCRKCGGAGKVNSNPCSSCGGNGHKKEHITTRVPIPRGVEDGEILEFPGMGGRTKRQAGNLYVRVRVAQDPILDVKNLMFTLMFQLLFHR
jgi:molecular chaperone DnaJ